LGPLASSISINIKANPRADGLGLNSRCLRRDLNDYFTKSALQTSNILSLISSPTTVGAFQDKMQGDSAAQFGVHSAGHFTIWGDPGGDFYTSPGPLSRLFIQLVVVLTLTFR